MLVGRPTFGPVLEHMLVLLASFCRVLARCSCQLFDIRYMLMLRLLSLRTRRG